MKTFELNTGDRIPVLGLGTWKMTPEVAADAVANAIELGYRHIDCAWIYENETGVCEGLKKGCESTGLTRDEIWLTSKLWNDCHKPEHVEGAIKSSLQRLGIERLDLYLIHWPVVHQHGVVRPENAAEFISLDQVPLTETWQALEDCVENGLCKNIGVSNLSIKKLDEVVSSARILPVVNQVECHPYLPQNDLVNYCNEKNIRLTAYSPLGSGDRPDFLKKDDEPSLFADSTIGEIAKEKSVSVAQILIAWAVQRGTIPIPKSATPANQEANLAAAEMPLSEDEMKRIDSIRNAYRFVDGSFWEREGGPYTVANLWDE